MKYAAATCTAAARPVVLTIGRVSDRRVLRALSRWWVRTCRTWTAKPISVPQMLALQACARDPLAYLLQLTVTLRAVLPRRWWYRLVGDPVRMILRLPDDVRTRVLQALVTLPDSTQDESRVPDDPLEAVRRAQRLSVYGEHAARGPVPTLAMAALTVRAAYGDGWYFNPARWTTSDGYAPFALAWVEYVGLQSLEARQRLAIADGTAIANTKDPKRVRAQLERAAYPAEVC